MIDIICRLLKQSPPATRSRKRAGPACLERFDFINFITTPGACEFYLSTVFAFATSFSLPRYFQPLFSPSSLHPFLSVRSGSCGFGWGRRG